MTDINAMHWLYIAAAILVGLFSGSLACWGYHLDKIRKLRAERDYESQMCNIYREADERAEFRIREMISVSQDVLDHAKKTHEHNKRLVAENEQLRTHIERDNPENMQP